MSHFGFSYKLNKTRCSYPPKTNAEKDGKCHWKVGNKVIDSSLYPKDYAKTWAKRQFLMTEKINPAVLIRFFAP